MPATCSAVPTLILGRAADVEVPLRAIESGAISKIWPVGLLSPARSDRGVSVRGVPVLGDFDDLERSSRCCASAARVVTRLVLTPSAFAPGSGAEFDPDAGAAARHWRPAGCRRSTRPATTLRLAPVAVEDLLLRPSVKIDYRPA